jgi:CheY-like chemotaxis protein
LKSDQILREIPPPSTDDCEQVEFMRRLWTIRSIRVQTAPFLLFVLRVPSCELGSRGCELCRAPATRSVSLMGKAARMPRILIFDKHGVYRSGLRCLIGEAIANAEVIEAADCNEASSQIRTGCFDLVLVGTGRSDLGPLDFLKKWREVAPTTRFAVVSASNTRTDILASLAAGFHGFISKHQPDTEILAAINDVLSGRIYVPSSVVETDDGNTLGGNY